MSSEDGREAQHSTEEEKLNGSASKPQEAAVTPTQKDPVLKRIWKKADLKPPTILLMLK